MVLSSGPAWVRQATLIVVDAQQGFSELCPAELPVPGALAIIEPMNTLLGWEFADIDATQDWHPTNHCSFLGQRDHLYPPHCLADSPGANFLPGLQSAKFHTIWRKGFNSQLEAYAVTAQHPGYIALLQARKPQRVVVCGIATNICCHYTARDLAQAGFEVIIASDASVGIDIPTAGLFQTTAKAEAEALGIRYLTLESLLDLA